MRCLLMTILIQSTELNLTIATMVLWGYFSRIRELLMANGWWDLQILAGEILIRREDGLCFRN